MSTSDDFLGERRRALEEAFFAQRNQQLLGDLQRQLAAQQQRESLAAASGISDPVVLDHLLAANIRGETITALGLVPLVFVAWADGTLDDTEKKALLAACEAEGITTGSIAYQLLETWLHDQPSDLLLQAWKDYIHAAGRQLSPEALSALKSDVLGRARKVAHASGGILGIGKTSQAEQSMLQDLENTFGA